MKDLVQFDDFTGFVGTICCMLKYVPVYMQLVCQVVHRSCC